MLTNTSNSPISYIIDTRQHVYGLGIRGGYGLQVSWNLSRVIFSRIRMKTLRIGKLQLTLKYGYRKQPYNPSSGWVFR